METRQAILDASSRLISAKGIGALSLREVARRLKLTHQAPYHHFKNRSEILAALAEQGFERLEAVMRERVGRSRGPVARFEACGEAYVAFALESPAMFQVMFRPELAGKAHRARLDRASQTAFRVLHEVVAECRAAGIARRLEPKALALTGWSVAHGLAALVVDGPLKDGKPEALARQVAATMGALLKTAR